MRGMSELPLVVLVHGAWHGAWCWAAVQAELDGRGLASLAVDLPGHGASTLPFTDLAGDAAHVADVVARAARPVVLVGHSYGGAVIGEAGAHPTFGPSSSSPRSAWTRASRPRIRPTSATRPPRPAPPSCARKG